MKRKGELLLLILVLRVGGRDIFEDAAVGSGRSNFLGKILGSPLPHRNPAKGLGRERKANDKRKPGVAWRGAVVTRRRTQGWSAERALNELVCPEGVEG